MNIIIQTPRPSPSIYRQRIINNNLNLITMEVVQIPIALFKQALEKAFAAGNSRGLHSFHDGDRRNRPLSFSEWYETYYGNLTPETDIQSDIRTEILNEIHKHGE